MHDWASRETRDLQGRVMYHLDKIKFWRARPNHPHGPGMLEGLRDSFDVLMRELAKRDAFPSWYEHKGPFR